MHSSTIQDARLTIKNAEQGLSSTEAIERIEQFCRQYPGAAEGWMCFTSAIFVKSSDVTLENAIFVSGSESARGTLLNGEFTSLVDGERHSLHIRSNGPIYSVYSFILDDKGGTGVPVKVVQQAFFGAMAHSHTRNDFQGWKLAYNSCWTRVQKGQPPHDIGVWQPKVGVFAGFRQGDEQ